MKKLSLLSVLLLGYMIALAQNMGIGTLNPDPSAKLEISSIDKGLLIPRVNTTQRQGIINPATGLLVFDTDTKTFWYYNASSWINLDLLNAGGQDWKLTGNTGINPATQFLGTTDNQPISLKLNNTEHFLFKPGGRLDVKNTGGSIFLGTGAGANEDLNNRKNVLVGQNAGGSINTGAENVGVGYNSLNSATTAFGNVAMGQQSLFSTTTGSLNVALGYKPLFSNTTGNSNVAIGDRTLFSNTTGGGNTSIGATALTNNTSGNNNTAIGWSVLGRNTTGFSNTANGVSALFSNTTGNSNTATGGNSLYFNTTGSSNTASGDFALQDNTTGSSNTANGSNSLANNTLGSYNTAGGLAALTSNLTGSFNTAIGTRADVKLGNQENATAIGSHARVDCNNCLVLGSVRGENSAANSVRVGIGTTSPDPSAQFEVKSTDKGMLAPRMKTEERTAILNPATGLLVFDTDTKTFWYHNENDWVNIDLQNAGGQVWNLSGNSGVNPATQFLGTTDNQPLSIKLNNTEHFSFKPGGRLGIKNTGHSVFLGEGAGTNDDLSDRENVFIGWNAGFNNTSGNHNVANGTEALRFNTTGSFNTANGGYALFSNTNGNSNTANGFSALFLNTTGANNTANGAATLSSNTTGFQNTANGAGALYSNTTGFNNTAVGYGALNSNTIGTSNTANGGYALFLNTTGHSNTANGGSALYSSTTGLYNTANGSSALYSNTTGNNNTANGSTALYSNTTGMYNTAVGFGALSSNTTGNSNTALGEFADVLSENLTNATVIGFGAIVDASNKVRIGNSEVTVIEGQVPFTSPSDGRFKTNITESVKGLDFILRLRPVVYNFEAKKYDQFKYAESASFAKFEERNYSSIENLRQSGFIAQEVEKVAKETGYDFNGVIAPRSEKETYSLSYSQFVVPLVKAIQEQQQIIEELKKEIELLKKKIQ